MVGLVLELPGGSTPGSRRTRSQSTRLYEEERRGEGGRTRGTGRGTGDDRVRVGRGGGRIEATVKRGEPGIFTLRTPCPSHSSTHAPRTDSDSAPHPPSPSFSCPPPRVGTPFPSPSPTVRSLGATYPPRNVEYGWEYGCIRGFVRRGPTTKTDLFTHSVWLKGKEDEKRRATDVRP